MTKWIDVKDALPDLDKVVLCIVKVDCLCVDKKHNNEVCCDIFIRRELNPVIQKCNWAWESNKAEIEGYYYPNRVLYWQYITELPLGLVSHFHLD